jgi:hypothetical protein
MSTAAEHLEYQRVAGIIEKQSRTARCDRASAFRRCAR